MLTIVFPTNYPCNQAVHIKGNGFELILTGNYFETFKLLLANLKNICLSSGRTVNFKAKHGSGS